MHTYKKLHFATPGKPRSAPAGKTDTAIEYIESLGIDAMELEFVRNIYIKENQTDAVKEAAEKHNVLLTIHGPYTLNLNSDKEHIRTSTVERIIQCARIGHLVGAQSVTFHPAYYLKQDPKIVYKVVRDGLEQMVKAVEDEKLDIMIAPETTGKPTQFGTLEELVLLAKEIASPHLQLCIDFAHLHARTNGKFNTAGEFRSVFDHVATQLGEEVLQRLHMHYSGLTYSEKGERKHLPFSESDANYMALLEVLKEYNVKGILVVESPLQEDDVLFLKNLYEQL